MNKRDKTIKDININLKEISYIMENYEYNLKVNDLKSIKEYIAKIYNILIDVVNEQSHAKIELSKKEKREIKNQT